MSHAEPETPRLVWRAKPVTQSACFGPTRTIYKQDRRSEVWHMSGASGDYVAKRFLHSPLRQRAALWTGLHPAQLELRRNAALQRAAVPVVAIVDVGIEMQRAGGGCHVWLITPRLGESLHRLLVREDVSDAARRRWLSAAATLTCQLLRAGFTFRDLKPSNIVIDEAGAARLLDVAGVRRGTPRRRVAHMLALMDRVLTRAGMDEAMRRHYADEVARRRSA